MDVKRSKSDGFMLRFPEGLRERVKAAAEVNGRSMNSEIVARLEDTFITESYAESLEIHGMKSDLGRKAREAAGIQERLAAIEAKLDQLLTLEDQYRARAERSQRKPAIAVRNEKPLPVRRRKDEGVK